MALPPERYPLPHRSRGLAPSLRSRPALKVRNCENPKSPGGSGDERRGCEEARTNQSRGWEPHPPVPVPTTARPEEEVDQGTRTAGSGRAERDEQAAKPPEGPDAGVSGRPGGRTGKGRIESYL